MEQGKGYYFITESDFEKIEKYSALAAGWTPYVDEENGPGYWRAADDLDPEYYASLGVLLVFLPFLKSTQGAGF